LLLFAKIIITKQIKKTILKKCSPLTTLLKIIEIDAGGFTLDINCICDEIRSSKNK
jgi:hypothetical protein